ncbi:MAG: DUF4169 family protein [Pseudomonadota bacterium]
MSTPINLRTARKAAAKRKRQAKADENAARFGRTKAQKAAETAAAARSARTLDQHRREDGREE